MLDSSVKVADEADQQMQQPADSLDNADKAKA